MSSCSSRAVTSSHVSESALDSNAVMRNWYVSLRLARSVITKSSSLTGVPTASSCSASVLILLICSSTSSPSAIIVEKKRQRRKSFCKSSIARQVIAIALRDFLLNGVWSSGVTQCSISNSPLASSLGRAPPAPGHLELPRVEVGSGELVDARGRRRSSVHGEGVVGVFSRSTTQLSTLVYVD
ncbi:hypothetical protein PHMEG_00011326 [Phytophthora megakarya]|uniref:Uncharacterized protein n=1 Tax=Phytophthora megakarya TaxID=4795 RepID=A0A225WD59_9STRA|nr:hypothetical protein PHMEG_00011326 [Phytophthora megakarya]